MNNDVEILEAYKQRLEDSCSNQLDADIEAFDNAIKTLKYVKINPESHITFEEYVRRCNLTQAEDPYDE